MPPIDFEQHTKDAFEEIKCAVGIAAIYIPKTGGQFSIVGIFDNRAQEIDPDTEIPVSSNVYTFGLKLDDIPFAPVKGDQLLIKTIRYRVIDVLEDGVDDVSVVLILHRVEGAL